jgi:hypothetical protein
MTDQEIINELLNRAQSCFPVAIAVNTILVKEFSIKDPYKYRDIIDKMVDQELVKNTFGDFIRILSKGKNIVDSGGYLKFSKEHPGKSDKREQTVRTKVENNVPSLAYNGYMIKTEWRLLIRSMAAVIFSFFTFHK